MRVCREKLLLNIPFTFPLQRERRREGGREDLIGQEESCTDLKVDLTKSGD